MAFNHIPLLCVYMAMARWQIPDRGLTGSLDDFEFGLSWLQPFLAVRVLFLRSFCQYNDGWLRRLYRWYSTGIHLHDLPWNRRLTSFFNAYVLNFYSRIQRFRLWVVYGEQKLPVTNLSPPENWKKHKSKTYKPHVLLKNCEESGRWL